MHPAIRTWHSGLVTLLLSALPAFSVHAQTGARVRAAENLRKEPNGAVLARMPADAPLNVVSHQGAWAEVEVEGWVWSRSLQETDREGFDLVVSADDGENLREAPNGEMRAYLLQGTLLDQVERRPGWIHVKRRAWMWGASLAEAKAPPTAPTAARAKAPPASAKPDAGANAAVGAGASGQAGSAPPRPRAAPGFARAGSAGAAILSAPGGDTVGRTIPRAELEVVARQGSWARVRLEGWTWLPAGDSAVAAGDSGAVTPAELRSDPQGSAGRLVEWQLQFISLEHAEKVRTDFFEGEPFMLTRYGGADGTFVYVAVPAERVAELKGLVPLELITVTARVRTGASSLTGTPILDLVSLDRKR